ATDGAPLRWQERELATVASPGADLAAAERALARLARERLVRVGRGSVEIAHPALLKDWPRLASARLAEMDRLRLLERLHEARVAWERADNHTDFLLHGALLDESRSRRALLKRGLSPEDRAFLDASLRAARFRNAKRGALGVVVAALLVGSAAGKHMLDEARASETRARAAAAEQEALAELAAMARRA